MLETISIVGAIMLGCALIFSPFVLWDLYKKKRHTKRVSEGVIEDTPQATIVWWEALLCGVVLVSVLIYFLLKEETGFVLPAIIAYPYYALAAFCLVYVSRKKIVMKKPSA